MRNVMYDFVRKFVQKLYEIVHNKIVHNYVTNRTLRYAC